MKGKCSAFSHYKQRNKVSLVYLDCKLEHDRYGWWISKLKRQKAVEIAYLEVSKEQTKYFIRYLEVPK